MMVEKVKIGNYVKQIRGVSYKPNDLHNDLNSDSVILLRANNINEGKINFDDIVYVDKSKVKEEQYLKKGDILVCASSGSKELVGKAAFINKDYTATFGAFCKLIRPKNCISEYLGHYFNSQIYRERISSLALGANINNIRNEHIDELRIYIPNKSEQQSISMLLNQVVDLINNRKKQLEKLDELVKARFVEMFGDPVKNSMRWKTAPLKNVTSKIGSGATPKGGKESYQTEGITLIRSMNVHDGRFEYKDLAHITEEQAEQLNNVIIEENDVFINITGASVARSCVVPKHILPARVNQHVAIIRCITSTLNPIFANNMFLNKSFKRKLLDIGETGGATRQAITKQQLESLTVILPPIELQEQFATFVEQTDKSKLEVQKSLEKLELLKKALMQKYFR